jgi:hypothetical protein
MALDMTTSGSFVDHGSAATVDDVLAAGVATLWAWVYRTANGANQRIIAKTSLTTNGWNFLCDNGAGEGALRLRVVRATTATDFVSNAGAIALTTWTFVCATFDDSATPKVKLYTGLLGTIPTETTYTTSTAGTGTVAVDAAASLYVGNAPINTTLPFKGRIARGGLIARTLTLAPQIQELWSASRWRGTPLRANVADTRLLFDYPSTTSITDLSGNGNNGTLAVATYADHPLFLSSLATAGVG